MVRKVAKHVARNKKQYWRKISTKDIEDHQDDIRVQEMTGGRREDQPDEILYQIDSEQPLGVKSSPMEISRPILRSIPKQRVPLDLNNLNTYKLLKPHSSVKPPGIDSLQEKDPSSISTKRLVENQKQARARKVATKKFQTATKQRLEALKKNAIDKADALAFDDPHVSQGYDLWNVRDESKEKTRALVGDELASYTHQVVQKYDWKVPTHIINKPTKLAAIENPLPGTSYNPSYEDHQDLLQKAVDVEVEKQQKELKLIKQLPVPMSQNESVSTRNSWLKEMSSGLFDENWIEDSEHFLSNSVSVGKPVKVQTKTVQQRNKEKERKIKEALAKQAKEKRIRDSTLLNVKSIRKAIDEQARNDIEEQVERKLQYEHREKFGTKKFGRYRFEEADLDLNLSEDITGNLRTMKTEGNLLHDRFKSLQKRNIIETRIRAKPTKTKMKKYEKRSVREVGENYRTK